MDAAYNIYLLPICYELHPIKKVITRHNMFHTHMYVEGMFQQLPRSSLFKGDVAIQQCEILTSCIQKSYFSKIIKILSTHILKV